MNAEQVLRLSARDAVHEDSTGAKWLMLDRDTLSGSMVRVDSQVRELAARGHLERIRNRSGWYAVWARTVTGAEYLRNIDRAAERTRAAGPADHLKPVNMRRARELRASGMGLVKISNTLGVSLQRLKAAIKAEGMTIPKGGPIPAAKRKASA